MANTNVIDEEPHSGTTTPPIATLEQVELNRAWTRLRLSCGIGAVMWILFIPLDLQYSKWVVPGSEIALLALRLSPILVFVPCIILLLRRNGYTRHRLQIIEQLCFQTAAWSIALMTIWTGGLYSHYPFGIAMVLALRAAAIGEPWRKGIMSTFIMASSYLVVMLLGATLSTDIASQFEDPSALTVLALTNSNLFGLAIFAVLGSHVLWRSRRLLYEYRSIGRYRLLKRISKGGMGEVWAAWHRGLKREIALKLLMPSVRIKESILRFEREVAATVSLSHPNTIRIFDHGITDDGVWYYAMELLQGEDLNALVIRDGAQPVDRSVYILFQAACSIAEAHSRGICHRDIKPENLFITNDGRSHDFVKVLDFGIARTLSGDEKGTSNITQTGFHLGTPAYLSPEVARAQPADVRSDVYGLGAVLYFMLAGQPPFQRDNTMGLIYAHAELEPEPVEQIRGKPLPADVEAILCKALAKMPQDRQQNAGELVTELEQCESFGAWQPAVVSAI